MAASMQSARQPRPQVRALEPVADAIHPHIVGASTKFNGDIMHPGLVEVWGRVRGSVRAPTVLIRNGGEIDGFVEADRVRNDGTMTGSVRARRIELSKRCTIGGDIRGAEIGMEVGAAIQAGTQMMTVAAAMLPRIDADSIMKDIEAAERRSMAPGIGNEAVYARPAEPEAEEAAAPVEPAVVRAEPVVVHAEPEAAPVSRSYRPAASRPADVRSRIPSEDQRPFLVKAN